MASAMEEDVFANRYEPIPMFNVPPTGNESEASDQEQGGKRKRDKMKDKVKEVSQGKIHHSSSSSSLQDRVFAKILSSVIPPEDLDDDDHIRDLHSSEHISRPGFSLPLMTNNFRRFNARIGVVFVFQAQAIRLLSWRTPSHTLSFISIYSFICLNPRLLPLIPILIALLFILVPAFLTRHPPPPNSSAARISQYSMHGPPLAPARIPRPATEMSKDFFRNMRDLQNMMEDYAVAHDLLLSTIGPPTNFSNEPLSTAIFLLLLATAFTLFNVTPFLPWRYISLVTGWAAISLGHPRVQKMNFKQIYRTHVRPTSRRARTLLDKWIAADIVLDTTPETREVEIFELQRRTSSSSSEFEPWLFTPSPWDPLHPARVAGERPKGCRFFEDVACPAGWVWQGKRWEVDLGSVEWVEERMVVGVEVEVEGERWVYDRHEEEGAERGEWRRRRWVRVVRRRVQGEVNSGQ